MGRGLAASLISPGAGPLLGYLFLRSSGLHLSNHIAPRAFLFEAVAFYIFAMPVFWFLHRLRSGLVAYLTVGAFVTWPVWILLTWNPPHHSVQLHQGSVRFFFTATSAIFGAIAGALFFAIMRTSTSRPNRGA
jgi:hypothetical protein